MKLKLAETFASIQGEGAMVGAPMFFIRFAGCAVASCPLHPSNSNLCDTDWSPKIITEDLEALAEMAAESVGRGGWVCITGGEPMDQPKALRMLTHRLFDRGLYVNLQTSGTIDGDPYVDALTVSPKVAKPDLLKITTGFELKLVYTGQSMELIREWTEETWFDHYFLMPLWQNGTANYAETISAVSELNKAGLPYRLAVQTHKYIGVR